MARPAFADLVRAQVAPLRLPADAEQKIVEEWSAQLEDAFDGLRACGFTDDQAWTEVQRQVSDAAARGGGLLEGVASPPAIRRQPASDSGLAAAAARLWLAMKGGAAGDARGGLRQLARQPGFGATVILTLAICLGANAAIFTVVHGTLLRPLPIAEPDRVVAMGDVYPTITPDDILSNDAPSYFDRLTALTSLEEQALFTFWFETLTLDGAAEEVRGMKVTPSLFRLLRVTPHVGRAFTDAEGQSGNGGKIILSYSLWQRLYGGDTDVLGRSLRLAWSGSVYTVVGVMPRDFRFFERGYDGHAGGQQVQFWLPLVLTPQQTSDDARTRYGYFHIGRLRPGATVQQVRAQLDALQATYVTRFPQFQFAELGMYTAVTPLQEALTRGLRRTLYLLWAGALFVLLIGAINLTNLTLARASERRRELATRLALGASRVHLARQLLIEGLIPAAVGGAAGLAVAAVVLRLIATKALTTLPNGADAQISGATIAFVAAVVAGVAVLMGLVPAAAAGMLSPNQVLGDDSRSATGGKRSQLFRRALAVTQVGLSVVLLIGATLLFSSFRYLLSLDAGFNAAGVTTATVFPPPSRYADRAAVIAFQDRLLEAVRAIPFVDAAGITSNIALSGSESPSSVAALGRVSVPQREALPSVVAVTPGYFEAMQTPLLRGRYFSSVDRENNLRVAIVDERLAAQLWPGEDALGQRISRGEAGPYTVVGVVREVRLEGLATGGQSIGTAYFPHTQAPPLRRLRWIAVRSPVDPAVLVPALRAAVAKIDRDLPLADVQSMDERTANAIAPQYVAMRLAALFAATALLLSMVGLYGVLVGLVNRRTREIGIRMALGDTVQGIFRLVLTEGVALIAVGLAAGLGAAALMAQTLEGVIFGVRAADPVVFLAVALVTGATALLACVEPAIRAARIDPVRVLT